MSIKFRLVTHRNPQDPAAAPKYYAQVVTDQEVTFKDLSETVARHTTMSAPDTYGVLMGLEEEIRVALRNGAKVVLGDLCILYPALKGDGADTEADYNAASHITGKTVKIRPRKSLRDIMANVPVEKVD